jgi:hypothetical protein
MDLGDIYDMIGERSCGGGWASNVTESVKRSILSIVENYATAIYLFVCLIGIYKTRIVLGGLYVMGDTSSCRGF